MLSISALTRSLVVHLVSFVLFIHPISAHRLANTSYPLFATIPSQSSTEHALAHLHFQSLSALGVACLVFYLSAPALRRAVSVSPGIMHACPRATSFVNINSSAHLHI